MGNIQELFKLTKDISVLYVEDDATLRTEMVNVFNDLFVRVDEASDGVEALALYNKQFAAHGHHYDLVITDINMPNMNGIELCQEITQINGDQIIIVISAHNESEYFFKLINLGVTHFILKPINMDNIITVLKKSAQMIHVERLEAEEKERIRQENIDLTSANEELEQQVKVEMYNADNNISILQQYKDAIDKILVVSKTDLDGVITYANDHFCRISGFSLDELIGNKHSIVRHPDNPPSLFEHMWSKLTSKKPWHGLLKNRAKDGSTYYVQSSILPLLNARGEVIEYLALREDVTDNIKYQKRLEERNKRIDAILDNQESIVILINASQDKPTLEHINAKFFQEYMYKDIKEFKNQHSCICELFVQREGYVERNTEDKHWTNVLIRQPDALHKVLMIDKYNNERTYHAHIKQLWLENEKHYIVTLTDITEIEKLRVLAEDAEKAKSAFLANMSHEIRTPINGINGFTQLLKNSPLNEKQHHYVNLIDASTQLLIGTINDILDFSKIESNKMELSYTKVNILTEMEEFVKLFIQKANDKNISFIVDIDTGIHPYVSIDPLHFKQILSNLISNALKFTPEGGQILFSIEKTSETTSSQNLHFLIKDNGIGIPKERHKAIFDSFTQADSSTTRKFGGTGLGLSISNSLVTLMGGKLELESEEHKGSSFYFDLDLKKERISKTPAVKDSTPLSGNIIFDLYVLIVEDYDINQILIKTLLDNFGIRSDLAENGKEAVDLSRINQYDLILMDINMPVMNGIDATYIIKQEDHNPVPIVALTANILDDDIRRCKEAGMVDSLIKPIHPEKLTEVLRTYAKETSVSDTTQQTSLQTSIPQGFPFQEAKDALALPDKTLISIITKFVSSTRALISEIEEAIESQDTQMISSLGHKMKGSASTLCFTTIAKDALTLEELPQEAFDLAKEHLLSIKTEINAIETKLANFEID